MMASLETVNLLSILFLEKVLFKEVLTFFLNHPVFKQAKKKKKKKKGTGKIWEISLC